MATRKERKNDIKMASLEALHTSLPSQLFVPDGSSAVCGKKDVSLSELNKFWSKLSSAKRREVLRIEKQTLFERVRNSSHCLGCRDLIVERYADIVSDRKYSLGANGSGSGACDIKNLSEIGTNKAISSLQDHTKDPSVHPWGGLEATCDSMLTVSDCFLDGSPLEVFESARTQKLERESLSPDACEGGTFGSDRGGNWVLAHCSLHTGRVSYQSLVDFWSTIGKETRSSVLQMKQEDFIERIKVGFCKQGMVEHYVSKEFRHMKELKRRKLESCCTQWFCGVENSNTSFRFQLSDSVVQADWQDCFPGDDGSVYQKFEWSLGTAPSKADIVAFANVGLSQSIDLAGLDLSNKAVLYITVRGWKSDGRSSELLGVAKVLKGKDCVHRRLILGDGYVSITIGEGIQQFLKQAEEKLRDGGGSGPHMHGQTRRFAVDILLDAATFIFIQQMEKTFREDAARKSAQSIFISLSVSLLEERFFIACKEITTLENQNKLLEEEEDQKLKEKERCEHKKLKEKEKKLRRKERLKGKGQKGSSKTKPDGSFSGLSADIHDPGHNNNDPEEEHRVCDIDGISARIASQAMAEIRPSVDGLECEGRAGGRLDSSSSAIHTEDASSMSDGNGALTVEAENLPNRRSQDRQAQISDGNQNGQSRREMTDSGGAFPKPRSVKSFGFQHETTSMQVHQKNSGQRYEADSPKCLDSWHRQNGDAHWVYPQVPQGRVPGSENQAFTVEPTIERKGEREPKTTDSSVMEVARGDHRRSALVGELVGNMQNDCHGLPDCTIAHFADEEESIFLSRFGGGIDGRVSHLGKSKGGSSASVAQTAPIIKSKDGLSTPAETDASSSASYPVLQNGISAHSPFQVGLADFSLFHFSDPAAAIQSRIESFAL